MTDLTRWLPEARRLVMQATEGLTTWDGNPPNGRRDIPKIQSALARAYLQGRIYQAQVDSGSPANADGEKLRAELAALEGDDAA